MNIMKRDQLIAAKERLHQLAEEAREADKRKAAKEYWEKTQAEERAQEAASMLYHQQQAKHLAQKENRRVEEEKAREDAEYLRRHNKTVKQVLSQVAKASGGGDEGDGQDDEEESSEESSSDELERTEHQNSQQPRQTGVDKQLRLVQEGSTKEGQHDSKPSGKHFRNRNNSLEGNGSLVRQRCRKAEWIGRSCSKRPHTKIKQESSVI